MGSSLNSGDDEVIAGINVTPLVDVVLVLLIIFLITAPVIYQSAIKVKLPTASTGEDAGKSPLNFTIDRDGLVAWNNDRLDWPALEEKLRALGPSAANETAMISADETTAHGKVVKLMDLLRRVGLTRFALNVEGAKP